MATKYFTGLAPNVAQVTTIQVTGYDAATTYSLKVGGVTICSCVAQGSANATAAKLVLDWNASVHKYATQVTAANTPADTVQLTSDVTGLPFVVTTSVAGGAGTFGAVTAATANSCANDVRNAANYSDLAAPGAGDTVILQDCAVNLCWGLDQSAVALARWVKKRSFTGKIGLDYKALATTRDGVTTDPTVLEYRECYLRIDAAVAEYGEASGTGYQACSARALINLGSNPCALTVFGTAATASDAGRPVLRLLANDPATTVEVRSAPGGVGIGTEVPGETGQLATVSVTDPSTTGRVTVGEGIVLGTWRQSGGTGKVNLVGGTLPKIYVNGGTCTVEGGSLTDAEVSAGTLYGNCALTGTAELIGGVTDTTTSSAARTWAAVRQHRGSQFRRNPKRLTVTSWLLADEDVNHTSNVGA